ncbi:MAG: NAD-dependent epimerase/dehydratase family protein, partial [Gemmatimonadales bacterium]
PQRTHDYYSRSKRDAERAVWRAADDGKLNAAALRPGVVYGERDRTFSNRIFRSFDAGIFPIIGSGNNHLGVVYAGNVGDAVARAVTCDATGPFNVASDGYISQADFFAILASHKRNRVRFVRVPKAAAMAGALTVYWYKKIVRRGRYGGFPTVAVNFLSGDNPYSCDRARAQLSWRPSTDPTTAVDRTGAWLRAAER